MADYVIPALLDDSLGHTVIVLPPGAAKTNTMIAACAWWLGRDPTLHIGYLCHNETKASERSIVIKNLIEHNEIYHAIFPNTRPNKDQGWSNTSWYLQRPVTTDKNPSFAAAGLGSGILGNRLDRAIIDDIADNENMKTQDARQSIRTFLGETLLTRFEGSPVGRAIMICTRQHEDDPAGWAIESGWHTIIIPGLDDEGKSYWPEERPAEKMACPYDLHDPDKMCCQKKQLGSAGFARQYLGIVQSEDSALFRRQNWKRYRSLPHEANTGGIFVDLAHTEKTEGDFTVIAVIARDKGRRYWRHVTRDHLLFPDVIREVKALRQRFGYPIIIEDSPGSKPLIQTLQRELGSVIPFRTGGRNKLARAHDASPAHEAGDWYLPEGAPWAETLIEEHALFPNARNDDTVDISTMQHLYWAGRVVRDPKTRKPFKRAWELIKV